MARAIRFQSPRTVEPTGTALTDLMERYQIKGTELAELAGCHSSSIYRIRESLILPSKPLAVQIAQGLTVLCGHEIKASDLWDLSILQIRKRTEDGR